jgi:hypothetical protein
MLPEALARQLKQETCEVICCTAYWDRAQLPWGKEAHPGVGADFQRLLLAAVQDTVLPVLATPADLHTMRPRSWGNTGWGRVQVKFAVPRERRDALLHLVGADGQLHVRGRPDLPGMHLLLGSSGQYSVRRWRTAGWPANTQPATALEALRLYATSKQPQPFMVVNATQAPGCSILALSSSSSTSSGDRGGGSTAAGTSTALGEMYVVLATAARHLSDADLTAPASSGLDPFTVRFCVEEPPGEHQWPPPPPGSPTRSEPLDPGSNPTPAEAAAAARLQPRPTGGATQRAAGGQQRATSQQEDQQMVAAGTAGAKRSGPAQQQLAAKRRTQQQQQQQWAPTPHPAPLQPEPQQQQQQQQQQQRTPASQPAPLQPEPQQQQQQQQQQPPPPPPSQPAPLQPEPQQQQQQQQPPPPPPSQPAPLQPEPQQQQPAPQLVLMQQVPQQPEPLEQQQQGQQEEAHEPPMLPFPSGYSPLLASGAHYKWPAHQGRNVGVWLRLLVDHVAHKRGGEGNEDVLEGCQPGPIDKVPDAVLLPLGEAFVAKFRHTVTRDAPEM